MRVAVAGLLVGAAVFGVVGVPTGKARASAAPASAQASAPSAPEQVTEVPQAVQVINASAQELQARLAGGEKFYWIDVREPSEYRAGHVPGSVLIPLGTLAARLSELDKTAAIVVSCQSGGRSARAADILLKAGFQHVTNMLGGFGAWKGVVETGDYVAPAPAPPSVPFAGK